VFWQCKEFVIHYKEEHQNKYEEEYLKPLQKDEQGYYHCEFYGCPFVEQALDRMIVNLFFTHRQDQAPSTAAATPAPIPASSTSHTAPDPTYSPTPSSGFDRYMHDA
jgi:hypothetical protein